MYAGGTYPQSSPKKISVFAYLQKIVRCRSRHFNGGDRGRQKSAALGHGYAGRRLGGFENNIDEAPKSVDPLIVCVSDVAPTANEPHSTPMPHVRMSGTGTFSCH